MTTLATLRNSDDSDSDSASDSDTYPVEHAPQEGWAGCRIPSPRYQTFIDENGRHTLRHWSPWTFDQGGGSASETNASRSAADPILNSDIDSDYNVPNEGWTDSEAPESLKDSRANEGGPSSLSILD